MVNKRYFAALLLGHAMASPVILDGAMQARDDGVARAVSLHKRYSELVEPRHDDKSGYGGGGKGYMGDKYGHKKGDDYGHKGDNYGHKDDNYGQKGDNYGYGKGNKYDHKDDNQYGHEKGGDYGGGRGW